MEERFREKIADCHAEYSWSKEELGLYDRGWTQLSNASEIKPPSDYRSWQYQTAEELETYPFVGTF